MNLSEGILSKIIKLIAQSNFSKILNKVEQEIDDDPEIQKRIDAGKQTEEELKKYLTHLCKKNPWHHLCKERDEKMKK